MGNTGKFSSSNDFGNVSNYLNQSAATAARDEVMNEVNSQISQAMTGDKMMMTIAHLQRQTLI